jgi:acetyl esterase/lipase
MTFIARNTLALCLAVALAGCTVAQTRNEPGPAGTARLMAWDDLFARPRPAADATISYGDDPLQIVDLWLPAGTGPHPTVLMVHGGCWTTGIAQRDIMNWIADDLRRRGIAVWNIEYRGVDRGGGYPNTFRDVASAADALRAHAGRYHLDLGRVVAVGHSAGGHLALWLAGRTRLPEGSPLRTDDPLPIHAVLSLGGLPDLEEAARSENGCGNEVIGQLTSGHFDDTSVPRLSPLGVPQVLVNGADDRIIPLAYAEGYARPMRAAGDAVTVRIVPATGHVELVTPDSAAWAVAVQEIEGALAR